MKRNIKQKILIIRFSSIGDVLQCMSVIESIKDRFPNSEIHWVVRSDIAQILELDNRIDKIWSFQKKEGFKGLYRLAAILKRENFTHIYDAHSNIRSNVIKLRICPFWKRWLGLSPKYTLRSKDRLKRILLFKFRINLFPKPFRGMLSYLKPLQKWGMINTKHNALIPSFPKKVQNNVMSLVNKDLSEYICLVPSAAWELKRWPVDYWKKLILNMPNDNFIIIGGPDDKFCEEIASVAPNRTINFAGKTSLLDSCYTVYRTALTISADTGFIHAADLFGKKGIFLAGPTAFGFPTGTHIRTIEKELPCRPCTKDGRGKCYRKIYKECLVSLKPELVAHTVKSIIN